MEAPFHVLVINPLYFIILKQQLPIRIIRYYLRMLSILIPLFKYLCIYFQFLVGQVDRQVAWPCQFCQPHCLSIWQGYIINQFVCRSIWPIAELAISYTCLPPHSLPPINSNSSSIAPPISLYFCFRGRGGYVYLVFIQNTYILIQRISITPPPLPNPSSSL